MPLSAQAITALAGVRLGQALAKMDFTISSSPTPSLSSFTPHVSLLPRAFQTHLATTEASSHAPFSLQTMLEQQDRVQDKGTSALML